MSGAFSREISSDNGLNKSLNLTHRQEVSHERRRGGENKRSPLHPNEVRVDHVLLISLGTTGEQIATGIVK